MDMTPKQAALIARKLHWVRHFFSEKERETLTTATFDRPDASIIIECLFNLEAYANAYLDQDIKTRETSLKQIQLILPRYAKNTP